MRAESTGPGTAAESQIDCPSALGELGTATESDQDFVYKFRLVIIGDNAVGKSSILHQFMKGIFSHDMGPTIGVTFCTKLIRVRDRRIKLELWDTGMNHLHGDILAMYCRTSMGGLLVFNITYRKSFTNLRRWLEDAQSKCAWPHKPVFILIGNMADLPRPRKVSKEEALSFATQHDMEYYETTARNGSDIKEVFHKLVDKILTLVDGGLIKIEEGVKGIVKDTEQQGRQQQKSRKCY